MHRKLQTLTFCAVATVVLAATAARADSLCGDVNNSGKLTTADALSVLRASVGQEVELVCPAPGDLVTTGDVTAFGAGSDGDVQAGATRSFTDNGDGTITDNTTNLMWEKKDDAGGIHDVDNTYTWTALTNNLDGTIQSVFLAALNTGSGFAGHDDWRIPNLVELESLRTIGTVNPAAYDEFDDGFSPGCAITECSCTGATRYWSSSSFHDIPSLAWDVNFLEGDTDVTTKGNAFSARAVRKP